jgi:hypothetical protein
MDLFVTMHPAYRSVNKHLTLCGCDRQLFTCGLFVGFGLFATLGSVAVGLVTFACFAVLGRFKTRDPIALRLLFNPGTHRNRYDPAVLHPFVVMLH